MARFISDICWLMITDSGDDVDHSESLVFPATNVKRFLIKVYPRQPALDICQDNSMM